MSTFSKSPDKQISSYKQKKRVVSFLLTIVRYVFLVLVGYVIIYPVLYMISNSIKSTADFTDASFVWLAHNPTFEHFKTAMEAMNFEKSIVSSLLYEVLSAFIQVASCAIPAYSLARYNMKEKPLYMVLLILLIAVPQQMIIIPLVTNFSNLDFFGIIGLINKLTGSNIRINIMNTGWTFWLPSLFGVGLRAGILIYIYMQFFKGLPKELEEAAWIDGSNPIQTFIRIIIPSSSVVIFTVMIFSIIWHWNDYYVAVMYTNQNYPLAVSLAQIQEYLTTLGLWGLNGRAIGIIMSGCVVFVTPPLIMYLILQRKFIQSIDNVGITG